MIIIRVFKALLFFALLTIQTVLAEDFSKYADYGQAVGKMASFSPGEIGFTSFKRKYDYWLKQEKFSYNEGTTYSLKNFEEIESLLVSFTNKDYQDNAHDLQYMKTSSEKLLGALYTLDVIIYNTKLADVYNQRAKVLKSEVFSYNCSKYTQSTGVIPLTRFIFNILCVENGESIRDTNTLMNNEGIFTMENPDQKEFADKFVSSFGHYALEKFKPNFTDRLFSVNDDKEQRLQLIFYTYQKAKSQGLNNIELDMLRMLHNYDVGVKFQDSKVNAYYEAIRILYNQNKISLGQFIISFFVSFSSVYAFVFCLLAFPSYLYLYNKYAITSSGYSIKRALLQSLGVQQLNTNSDILIRSAWILLLGFLLSNLIRDYSVTL